MIVGIGTDIVEIEKLRLAMVRRGDRLRNRAFTEGEIAYCEERASRYQHYAVRFAAKEAVMKALGHGWGAKVCWLDIEVARARSGKPEIVLHDKTAQLAAELGIRRWALSITHTKDHGLAFVVAQDE